MPHATAHATPATRTGRLAFPRTGSWWLFALWAVAILLLTYQTLRSHGRPIYGIDFRQPYYAAHNLWTLGDPYRRMPGVDAFVYPPSSALLFLPVGLLGVSVGTLTGLGAASLSLAGIAGTTGYLIERRFTGPIAALALIFLCVTLLGPDTMAQGNLTLLVCALGTAAIGAATERRWLLAAVIVGLTIAIKPLLVPMLVVFLIRRQWRAAAVAIALPIALNLVCIPLLNRPADFITKVIPLLGHGSTLPLRYNLSIWGLGQRQHLPTALVLVLRVAVLVLAIAVVLIARHRPVLERIVAWSIVPVIAFSLVSELDEPHYGLVAFPLLCLYVVRGGYLTRLLAAGGAVMLTTIGASDVVGSADWGLAAQLLAITLPAIAVFEHRSNRSAVPEETPALALRA